MEVIHKHPLVTWGSTRLVLPKSAKVLSVGVQKDQVVLWEIHDFDDKTTEYRHFESIFTGEKLERFVSTKGSLPFSELFKFTGSVQDSGGIVTHVFEMSEIL